MSLYTLTQIANKKGQLTAPFCFKYKPTDSLRLFFLFLSLTPGPSLNETHSPRLPLSHSPTLPLPP